jgi:hypothetical protein
MAGGILSNVSPPARIPRGNTVVTLTGLAPVPPDLTVFIKIAYAPGDGPRDDE